MKGKQINRAQGGGVGTKPMLVSGNPNVVSEAKDDDTNGRKRGGAVNRKRGGKVLGLMTGGGVKARLDRPGRKSGGAVGANTSPLSTANKVIAPEKYNN